MREIIIYRPDVLKRVAIFGLVGYLVMMSLSIRRHYIYLSYQFNGRIDSIRYGDKGTAVIIIKGKEFSLNEGWSHGTNNVINKGDTMIKLKDSLYVKLIRPNGQIIIDN